jgi:hypothetical protein
MPAITIQNFPKTGNAKRHPNIKPKKLIKRKSGNLS